MIVMHKIFFLFFILLNLDAMDRKSFDLLKQAQATENPYNITYLFRYQPSKPYASMYDLIKTRALFILLAQQKDNAQSLLSHLPLDLQKELSHFIAGDRPTKSFTQYADGTYKEIYSITGYQYKGFMHLFRGIETPTKDCYELKEESIEPWLLIFEPRLSIKKLIPCQIYNFPTRTRVIISNNIFNYYSREKRALSALLQQKFPGNNNPDFVIDSNFKTAESDKRPFDLCRPSLLLAVTIAEVKENSL